MYSLGRIGSETLRGDARRVLSPGAQKLLGLFGGFIVYLQGEECAGAHNFALWVLES